MKTRSSVVQIVLLGLVLLAPPALADNGPHGGYSPTTDGCAGCHRTHSASAPALLTNTAHNLCLTCHGSSGNGADTNVYDGVYLDRDATSESPPEGVDGISLKGGGFVNVLMDSDWDGSAVPALATSKHTYDGGSGTAWGNGDLGSGPGPADFSLTCTSCHDPHGGAGIDPETGERIASYRILRDIPTGSGADPLESTTDVPPIYPITDETDKTYTLTNTLGLESGAQHADHGKTEVQYFGEVPKLGLTEWCAQCHTRYMADVGSGSTDSGDGVFAYRHLTRGVTNSGGGCDSCHPAHGPGPFVPPNEYNVADNVIHYPSCITCHVAHGTSAQMIGLAADVEWPDGSISPSGDERSSLLRMDNRGVCQMCHEK